MARILVTCEHCGEPFEPVSASARFCCAGCEFVHGLIESEGLGQFYELRANERLPPAGSGVLTAADAEWTDDAQSAAEAGGTSDSAEARFDLQGLACLGCVWLIETLFRRQPGSVRIRIDAPRGELALTWHRGRFSLRRFVDELHRFGYRLAPAGAARETGGSGGPRLGVCGGLALNAMAFTLPRYLGMESDFALAGVFEMVASFSATASLLAGGSYFATRAWAALEARRLTIDVPIAAGIFVAWTGSVVGWATGHNAMLYFDFVAVFIFLMLVGRRLQEASVERNRSRLLRCDPMLQQVTLVDASEGVPERRVPLSELSSGNEFIVRTNGVIPVSSQLVAGPASLSFEWIDGEAVPRHYAAGAIVPSGAVNLGRSPIRLVAREMWADSLLAKLAAPALAGATAHERLLSTVLGCYIGFVALAALVGGGWWLATTGSWPVALQVFISAVVVSCPCALGVAIPMAHELAAAALRRIGLYVRSVDVWSRLRGVRSIVFDKTGTLTLEAPQLVNPDEIERLSPVAIEALEHLVGDSRHPISVSLREALCARGLSGVARRGKPVTPDAGPPDASHVREFPGRGVAFTDRSGAEWTLGRADWHARGEVAPSTSGDTVFRCDAVRLAAFRFSESLRPNAIAEVSALRRRGFDIHILSGDGPARVEAMARKLDVPRERALSRLSPEEKGAWVALHAANALYVGDGANDSLAFDAARCRGTPAVERGWLAEKADFYFLSRSLRPVRALFDVAQVRQRAVRRALVFAVVYNVAALALALTGHMNPLVAAVLMPLSSIATLGIVAAAFSRHRRQWLEPDGNASR